MKTNRSSEFSRRQFMRSAGVGLAACAAQPFIPRVLAGSAAKSTLQSAEPRALVLIHLQGGFDGLSMFVPFQDDAYYRLRPTLAVRPNDVISLEETWGLNRASQPFESLFKDGKMAIVPAANYPRPSNSHYRAAEIWHTASASDELLYSGWIGRCFSHLRNAGPVHGFYSTRSMPRLFVCEEDHKHAPLAHAGEVFRSSLASDGREPLDLLAQIGERAAESRATEVYFVAVPGFDTHARQWELQNARLYALSEALRSLQRRLEQRGVADRVLTMAFSEFGRSAAENSQGGTDHGEGAPVFMIGKNVRGGFSPPADFRQIVQPLASDWLGVPPSVVFARDYGRVELFRASSVV